MGGYMMKGKVQFTELQLLKLVKGDKWQSKSRVLLKQVEGNSDFILFCQILNSFLAPEHFQHNQLAFYHYAWLAIADPTELTPDWENTVEKTVMRQVKALGIFNEPTCLGPYLEHLYRHFHKMNNKKMEEPKKWKAHEQSASNSETEMEEEKETKGESPNATWIAEASRLTQRWP
ncbi:hypothetical protein R1flu_025266 [Riccia fluitans]|uniref:Uncharacterized protein n=1 Tax=Riccia fluitans TaxID=41844 RepID=A0ABD1XXN8_9MARC